MPILPNLSPSSTNAGGAPFTTPTRHAYGCQWLTSIRSHGGACLSVLPLGADLSERGRSADSYTGKRYTVEAPNTRDATHGPAYTVPETELIDADKMTLYHNFLIGCGFDDGNRPCYGRRTIDPATGKAGAYEWFTYNQIKTRMDDLASGMVATCGLKRQEKVGIFCKNRIEWSLIGHACDRMRCRSTTRSARMRCPT